MNLTRDDLAAILHTTRNVLSQIEEDIHDLAPFQAEKLSLMMGDKDWKAEAEERERTRRRLLYRLPLIRAEKGYRFATTAAKALGIPYGRLYSYESGARRPSRDDAEKIANLYGINADDLRGARIWYRTKGEKE